jgi:hypothetical protein
MFPPLAKVLGSRKLNDQLHSFHSHGIKFCIPSQWVQSFKVPNFSEEANIAHDHELFASKIYV